MSSKLTRRDFLRRTSTTAAIAAAATTTAGAQVRQQGWHGDTRVELIPSYCEMCFWRCGILAEVKDGKVLKVRGNPNHPLTKGKLCARGNAGPALLNDPDRLKFPQIRTGARGEGKLRRASWDEALNMLADRLKDIKKKYGPEAIAMLPHGVSAGFFSTVMKAFGTPNIAEPAFAQCKGAREVAYQLTFGRAVNSPEPVDLEEAKVIVLIGSHIGENVFTSQVTAFSEGLKRGAKLIVVDPRLSTAASKANWWMPIRPGTDIALLLAWMNVIISENLYDKEFLDKYAIGFKELSNHVKPFTPEWAAAQTDLDAGMIRDTARAMAAAKPAVAIHPGRHVSWYGDDTQRARAMAILTALLGAYGRKGGMFLPSKLNPAPGRIPMPSMPDSDKGRVDGGGTTFPLAAEESQGLTQQIVDATLTGSPYPIKAWVVFGQNVFESIPQRQKTWKAIQNLEFLAVVDVLPVEQTDYADIVLPECTYLERYDPPFIATTAKQPFVAIRQPACQPMYESKPGWWIAKETAKRLGLQDYLPWTDPDDHLSRLIAPMGIDKQELLSLGAVAFPGKPYIDDRTDEDGPLFPTQSGKIELVSSVLSDLKFDPLPVFTPPEAPPEGYARLIYGRAPMHSFARTENNKWLDDLMPENQVWIGPEFAAISKVKDGQWVTLENQDGYRSAPLHVRVTDAIRNDCAYMVHGFGANAPKLRKAFHKGASDTPLISRVKVDPIMGGTGMRVNFVRIFAAS
jgi:thiosulfate reductase/polysulfide reductase chain A